MDRKPNCVMLTGGTGSVGLNICEELLDQGVDVVLFARKPLHAHDEKELGAKKGALYFYEGDVLQKECIADCIRLYGVSDFVHGAALTPDLTMEREQGKQVMEINCLGLMNALDASKELLSGRFVFLGSVSAYGTTAFDQDSLVEGVSVPKPNSLYELSKFTAEKILLRYLQLYPWLDVCVARVGDVFGPWEHHSGVRPHMSFPFQATRMAIKGEAVVLPRPCRQDWVYARDIAKSIFAMLTATKLNYSVFPLCSGFIWSMAEWCELLAKRFAGFTYALAGEEMAANIHVNQTVDNAPMSVGRLVEDVGYTPSYDLQTSFADYMAWLEDHPNYILRGDSGH